MFCATPCCAAAAAAAASVATLSVTATQAVPFQRLGVFALPVVSIHRFCGNLSAVAGCVLWKNTLPFPPARSDAACAAVCALPALVSAAAAAACTVVMFSAKAESALARAVASVWIAAVLEPATAATVSIRLDSALSALALDSISCDTEVSKSPKPASITGIFPIGSLRDCASCVSFICPVSRSSIAPASLLDCPLYAALHSDATPNLSIILSQKYLTSPALRLPSTQVFCG